MYGSVGSLNLEDAYARFEGDLRIEKDARRRELPFPFIMFGNQMHHGTSCPRRYESAHKSVIGSGDRLQICF